MLSYVVWRLVSIVPTLFISSLIVFSVVRLIPGDAIDMLISQMPEVGDPAVARQRLEVALGLDQPMAKQYVLWVGNVLAGDLGQSIRFRTPVLDEITSRLPVTIEVASWSLLFALLIALPVGVYSAIRQETVTDYLARSFSMLAQAAPGFWLGVLVVLLPALWWGWSAPRYVPFSVSPWGNFRSLLLPALVLSFSSSAVIMRLMRTMMLEVLRQDYVRTAWAKGAGERRVVLRHALKNAMIPVITLVGILVPTLFGGTVIIEQIFRLPGLGVLLIEAVSQRDYPIIQGVFLVAAVVVVLANLAVDLCYGLLDPRVQHA